MIPRQNICSNASQPWETSQRCLDPQGPANRRFSTQVGKKDVTWSTVLWYNGIETRTLVLFSPNQSDQSQEAHHNQRPESRVENCEGVLPTTPSHFAHHVSRFTHQATRPGMVSIIVSKNKRGVLPTTRVTFHAIRITHHASRITFHAAHRRYEWLLH